MVIVKRTKSRIPFAFFDQWNVVADHIDDVGAVSYIVNYFFSKFH